MSEMIERCVMAGAKTGLDFAEWHADAQRELVVAIISATREPTEAMLDSGMEAHAHHTDPVEATHLWQAMIDEALRN